MNTPLQPRISFAHRIGLFICFWIFFSIVGNFIITFITHKWGGESTPALRIATIIQDLIIFIIPSIATALLLTRLPATFLGIDRSPAASRYVLAIITLIVSIPAMNWIIDLNANIHLPDSMQAIEQWMREREILASEQIKTILGGTNVADLIMSILIVGVLAGVSEELFFRGALQKILLSKPMNPHFVIWVVAIVFSAMHLQFYGFIPRMLLGAFFGYLAWWSGSLWLPIVAHAANNIITITFSWLLSNGVLQTDLNKLGATHDNLNTTVAIASAITTVAAIIYLRFLLFSSSQISCGEKQNHGQDTSL